MVRVSSGGAAMQCTATRSPPRPQAGSMNVVRGHLLSAEDRVHVDGLHDVDPSAGPDRVERGATEAVFLLVRQRALLHQVVGEVGLVLVDRTIIVVGPRHHTLTDERLLEVAPRLDLHHVGGGVEPLRVFEGALCLRLRNLPQMRRSACGLARRVLRAAPELRADDENGDNQSLHGNLPPGTMAFEVRPFLTTKPLFCQPFG